MNLESLLQPLLDQLAHDFNEKVPFNKTIGMNITSLTSEAIDLRFRMQPHLIGNFNMGILHGGVTASVLDVAGGVMAMAALVERHMAEPVDALRLRLAKVSTIDLRIDYLRPGKGEEFVASASVLRAGNKVTVTRMELHNETGHLVAAATGTYLVG